MNTDEKALAKVNLLGIKTLQIGQALTRGRGTGNKPELGELAAKNEEAQIKSIMHGADMIFFPYTQTTSSTHIKNLIEERLI